MRLSEFFLMPVLLVAFAACSQSPATQKATGAEPAVAANKKAAAPAKAPSREGKAVATFASGCFWCSEEVFEQLKGVQEVVSGYTGGKMKNPSYRDVTTGTTGHAEAIQIWYDPNIVTYPELLEIFFVSHDPTTLNRQGADVGTQYRSSIFYKTPEEKQLAEAYIKRLNESGEFNQPVVTEVVPYDTFYVAEKNHQDYFKLYPNDPYMRAVSKPKVEKVRKQFKDKLKEEDL